MQLGLTHRAFEAQQKAVVEAQRVVDAIGVGDEGVEQAQISSIWCQSRQERARRDTSMPRTSPR
jgi:hypothetical protein